MASTHLVVIVHLFEGAEVESEVFLCLVRTVQVCAPPVRRVTVLRLAAPRATQHHCITCNEEN